MRGAGIKTIGLFITGNTIRICAPARSKNLPAEEYSCDISQLKEFLKTHNLTQDPFTLAVSRSYVSIRYMKVPSVDLEEIRRIVAYKIDKLFPYKAEELIFDVEAMETDTGGYSQVMVAAAKKELIAGQVALLKKADIAVERVGISTLSLFDQVCGLKTDEASYLLIDREDALLDMVLVKGKKLVFERGVAVHPFSVAEALKEIATTWQLQKVKGITVDKVILSSRGEQLKGFESGLKNIFGDIIERNDTISVARGIAASIRRLDLLPKESRIQQVLYKKRKALVFFLILLALNASLVANSVYLKFKERSEYAKLLRTEINKIAQQVYPLQKQIDRASLVRKYSESGQKALALLTELFKIAPDGVRLTSLDISDNVKSRTLVISGEAVTAEIVLKFASSIRNSAIINKADVNHITRSSSKLKQGVEFRIMSQF